MMTGGRTSNTAGASAAAHAWTDTPPPPGPAARMDALLLAVLIVAMCSQIDPLTIGRDTFATEGYVTKQLKIALSDIALLLTFAWFAARTTILGAWRRLWWPPLPCWALLAAMTVAMLHSPHILDVTGEKSGDGAKAVLAAIKAKESKEALAEIAQFAAYFVAAPLLFVNLLHDRRSGFLIDRRRFALHVFSGAVVLTVLAALAQWTIARGGVPRGTFGSPNIFGVFLCLALPLMAANALHAGREVLPVLIVTGLTLVAAVLTMASPWAVAAVFMGVAVAGLVMRRPGRAALALSAMTLVAFLAWRAPLGFTPLDKADSALSRNRAEFLRVRSATQKVKKQYIEWYAALGWSVPRKQEFASGLEPVQQFATGVGPGNYQGHIGPYYSSLPNEEKMPPDSNNLYLVQAVSLGVVGLGALLWVWGHFAGLAWRAARCAPWDWLGSGALASLCAFMAVNFFHAGIVRGVGIVLAFVLSLAAVAAVAADRSADRARLEPRHETLNEPRAGGAVREEVITEENVNGTKNT